MLPSKGDKFSDLWTLVERSTAVCYFIVFCHTLNLVFIDLIKVHEKRGTILSR